MNVVIYRFDTTLVDLRGIYRSAMAETFGSDLASRNEDVRLLSALGPVGFVRALVDRAKVPEYIERLTHAIQYEAETSDLDPLVFGAQASIERLRASGTTVLLESSLPRRALQAILERIGWRGHGMYDAILSEEDSPERIVRLVDTLRIHAAEPLVWVCGMPVELARAEEVDPILKVLVEERCGSRQLSDEDVNDRVLTVPTVALVPELMNRLFRRSSTVVRRGSWQSDHVEGQELIVA